MAYTPPVGTVDLSLRGSYPPPVGTVDLDIGASESIDRTLTVAAATASPSASVRMLRSRRVVLAATTATPTASIALSPVRVIHIVATTSPPTAAVHCGYDANLLSEVHQLSAEVWNDGTLAASDQRSAFQPSSLLFHAADALWAAAPLVPGASRGGWSDSERRASEGPVQWAEAESAESAAAVAWNDSLRMAMDRATAWNDGIGVRSSVDVNFRNLPRLERELRAPWADGRVETAHYGTRFGDGPALAAVEIELWEPAGYPGNALNPGPPLPPIFRPPWGTDLKIICPLPGTTLRIGRTPCVLIAEREIAVRRTYMSINAASLVRWPDMTPLPCTTMTVETDFESWCWALSATLAGPEAWALVQPNLLACQVQATINGQIWRFLLDVPSTNRSFNSHQVTLKGRSRSAWLHDPYMPTANRSEANARTLQQLGEAALDNTGWTLDWQGEDWLVPAGRYNSHNTPIGALIRLANVTNDGLYTHPHDQVITLHKRWPVASWLVDGEVVDLSIPESAVISLSQSPVYTQLLNGIYVSGTSHGALALVKIAGTDGALQPAEPIVDELLCDSAGVAARQRGLNALSDSGAGFTMDAEVLLTPEIGLVRPGLIVSIAGMKGISRSVKISAQWNNGLSVRQSVGLERREVEA